MQTCSMSYWGEIVLNAAECKIRNKNRHQCSSNWIRESVCVRFLTFPSLLGWIKWHTGWKGWRCYEEWQYRADLSLSTSDERYTSSSNACCVIDEWLCLIWRTLSVARDLIFVYALQDKKRNMTCNSLGRTVLSTLIPIISQELLHIPRRWVL